MFDIFYTGPKPDLFVFEKPARDIQEASNLSRTEFFWFIDGNNDYTNFDFSWQPPHWDYQYTHVFPSQWHANGGVYFARKDSVNPCQLKFQNTQSVRRKVDMSKWYVPSNIDTSHFDFSWHPNPLEEPYNYQFPTQWQRDGGPIYIGTAGIKYVASQKVYSTATQIFYIDFLNEQSKTQFNNLKEKYPTIKSTRYVDSYLNVIKRIVNQAESKFVWIISSICDYRSFDFSWHPEAWQEEMIHVFPSGNQKRGDTFYINVESFKSQSYDLELLDWFNVINYSSSQMVQRFPAPKVVYTGDNLVEVVKNYDFKFPYANFTNQSWTTADRVPCLWSAKDREITSSSWSNAICTIPRDIKLHLQTQIYDYPHIITPKPGENVYLEVPLDVVYISNGEPDAEKWYKHLCNILNRENNSFPALKNSNLIHRVSNVNGRMAAYKAAAEKSTTPWFFAVFAKLEVNPDFDFSWQPDYFQEPKHYIFNARNPVNDLEYGHMGMIAYNKRLVLETMESGLDFTLSKAHDVVPLLSGTAHFNQDPWTTWRTAFREVVKLKHFSSTQPSVETAFRLKKWLTKAEGNHAKWSLRGAADAVEYYESVNGDFDQLMFTYEWDWLRNYYSAKY